MEKPLLIVASLLISVAAFAQKKEFKGTEKQIRKGDLTTTQTGLKSLRIAVEGTEFAPQYCLLEAQASIEMARKNTNVIDSLQAAGQAFTRVRQLEGDKGRYASQLKELSNDAINTTIKRVDLNYKNKDYKNVTIAFEQVYRLNSQGTVFLYNAAVVSVEGKDYDKAVRLYIGLKDLGYDGSEILCIATNKQTKKEETLGDKNQCNLMVKANAHGKSRTGKTPSKRADVVKNIASAHVEQHKIEGAIKTFEDTKKAHPKDASIILTEANVHLQLDSKDKFKELTQEAAQFDSKNADLYYDIGVINVRQGNALKARKASEQTLKIRPNYANTALNISAAYTSEGNGLIEKMNALGDFAAGVKKFNESRDQKDDLFKKGAEILEDFTKSNGNVENILGQSRNTYGALGDSASFQHIKKLLGR